MASQALNLTAGHDVINGLRWIQKDSTAFDYRDTPDHMALFEGGTVSIEYSVHQYTYRMVVPPSLFEFRQGKLPKKIKFRSGIKVDIGKAWYMSEMWTGLWNGPTNDPYDFDSGTKVQVLWDGNSYREFKTADSDWIVWSDDITIDIDPEKPLIVSYYLQNYVGDSMFEMNSISPVTRFVSDSAGNYADDNAPAMSKFQGASSNLIGIGQVVGVEYYTTTTTTFDATGFTEILSLSTAAGSLASAHYEIRSVIPAAALGQSGWACRLHFGTYESGPGLYDSYRIVGCAIGRKAAGTSYDFDGTPSEVLFNGKPWVDVSGADGVYSDITEVRIDKKYDLVVSFYVEDSGTDGEVAHFAKTGATGYRRLVWEGRTYNWQSGASLTEISSPANSIFGVDEIVLTKWPKKGLFNADSSPLTGVMNDYPQVIDGVRYATRGSTKNLDQWNAYGVRLQENEVVSEIDIYGPVHGIYEPDAWSSSYTNTLSVYKSMDGVNWTFVESFTEPTASWIGWYRWSTTLTLTTPQAALFWKVVAATTTRAQSADPYQLGLGIGQLEFTTSGTVTTTSTTSTTTTTA